MQGPHFVRALLAKSVSSHTQERSQTRRVPDRQACSPRPRKRGTLHRHGRTTSSTRDTPDLCLTANRQIQSLRLYRFLFVTIRVHSWLQSFSASICGWLAFEPVFSPFAQVFPALRLDKLARSNRSRDFHAPKTWVTGARLFHVEPH
jgi:hypothetical protein